MLKAAKIIIYDDNTGKTVKEIPLNFWFSFAEEKIEDRHFNIGLEEYELKEGESVYIQLKLSDVLKEIQRVMRGL